MNRKSITLYFSAWILFLSVLFLLGRLAKDDHEENLQHLSESKLSQHQGPQSMQKPMESPMESRMESRTESGWAGIRRAWRQVYSLMGSMRNISAFTSHKVLSFEKEVSQENTQNLRQEVPILPTPWEALGTSIPATEE